MPSREDAPADSSQPTAGAPLGTGFLWNLPGACSADRQGVLSQGLPPPVPIQEAQADDSPNCLN